MTLDSKLLKTFQARALQMRQWVLAMAYHGGGAHIAPAYSMIDVLAVLFEKYLPTLNLESSVLCERDRFILSKGHGCCALYAALIQNGTLPFDLIQTYCTKEGSLGGHPDMRKIPGVEASTGSLGHGLGFAIGQTLALRLLDYKNKVYTILGDGECQEGSVWESALFAGHSGLDQLVAIIDYNKLQGMGPVSEINNLNPFSAKWESFGWSCREIDGHDFQQINDALSQVPFQPGKPSAIIAHTIKGKGLSFMEGKTIWHYKLPKNEEFQKACQELQLDPQDPIFQKKKNELKS